MLLIETKYVGIYCMCLTFCTFFLYSIVLFLGLNSLFCLVRNILLEDIAIYLILKKNKSFTAFYPIHLVGLLYSDTLGFFANIL